MDLNFQAFINLSAANNLNVMQLRFVDTNTTEPNVILTQDGIEFLQQLVAPVTFVQRIKVSGQHTPRSKAR